MKYVPGYHEMVVVSFWQSGHRDPVGIRPLPGQIFDQDMGVECSRRMRDLGRHPIGTRFKVRACYKRKETSRAHVYVNPRDSEVVLSDDQVEVFLARRTKR